MPHLLFRLDRLSRREPVMRHGEQGVCAAEPLAQGLGAVHVAGDQADVKAREVGEEGLRGGRGWVTAAMPSALR